jgi:hypothetical protein
MDLFQADDLSLGGPVSVPLDDATCHIIDCLLRRYWPSFVIGQVTVRQVVGAGAVSTNYLVEAGGEKYLLKTRRGAQERSRLRAEFELARFLERAGIPVQKPVEPNGPEPLAGTDEQTWMLYQFEEGQHFTGSQGELEAAADAFGRLVKATLPIDATSASYGNGGFLDTLEQLVAEYVSCQPASALTHDLVEHTPTIVDAIQAVRAGRPLVESRTAVIHLDYHPANLVMREGRVAAILDLEDVRSYPIIAALGFGGYKLLREMMTRIPQPDATIGMRLAQRWVAGWTSHFPEPQVTLAHLRLGAEYRVLALIHFIVEGSVVHGDGRFLYDLPKQIRSLYELPYLFGPSASSLSEPYDTTT